MHPAYSVIFFTTASGAGYGLLLLLGIGAPLGLLPADRWLGLAGLGVALALISAGLLASTFHLGHPERAWRAFSQWRSSWLSREGVASVATYLPAGLFGIGWVFLERTDGFWGLMGVLAAAGAFVTVWCTGKIYATLKAVPRWRNGWTVPNYQLLSLASGALLASLLAALFGAAGLGWLLGIAIIATAGAWAGKAAYWAHIGGRRPRATAESATGLGRFGRVRLLEPPHTEPNYLQKEMGYAIARKHARRLRLLAHLLGFALPLALMLAAIWLAPALALLLAVPVMAAGLVIERWLFFAEAQHTQTLYYGARAV
jgi:DMSO reductase anchor subunit